MNLCRYSEVVESVEHVNDRESSFTPVADNNTRPCVTLSSRAGVDVLYRLDCERLNATQRLQASDSRFAEGSGVGGADVLRCIETFVETKHERSLSLDTTIFDRQAEEMYFTKEEPKMADHLHPMEGAILDFSVTRMRLIELFSRDGEICADEQATLDLFDDAKQTVKHLHNLDRAVETYKKQYRHGITRYGRQKWNLAGLAVEPYDPDAA